jgi:hypothetical protein
MFIINNIVGDCKVADTYVFNMKVYRAIPLSKKETLGNVLSIVLTPLFKNSDQQMIGKGDFLT